MTLGKRYLFIWYSRQYLGTVKQLLATHVVLGEVVADPNYYSLKRTMVGDVVLPLESLIAEEV